MRDIQKKVKDILLKKEQERLKQLEKKMKEQGRREAFDVAKLYDLSLVSLNQIVDYLNSHTITFRSSGDAYKCLCDFAKLQLELLDRGVISPVVGDNPYEAVISRVDELIGFKNKTENIKNTNNDKNNNNILVINNDSGGATSAT